MVLQEEAAGASAGSVLRRVIEYLNYPFISQDQFKVSILSLILLVVVIFVSAGVSRTARRVLENRVLPRFHHVDAGLKYTLLRLLHYLIITTGILYGMKLGFAVDLTGVAVVLSLLSVGMGFGLQYIASDLASGFILLFERPVRVRDHLKIGEIEGRVTAISLRSTRVVTNDGVAVIIPNSELIRNKVINWSYSSRVRIRLSVAVAYGSEVSKVSEALIEAGSSVEAVLYDPPPKVQLTGFGESAIDFDLLVWIDKPHDHRQIRSDINVHIDRVFRKAGIEIPVPQREVRLRSASSHGVEEGAVVEVGDSTHSGGR